MLPRLWETEQCLPLPASPLPLLFFARIRSPCPISESLDPAPAVPSLAIELEKLCLNRKPSQVLSGRSARSHGSARSVHQSGSTSRRSGTGYDKADQYKEMLRALHASVEAEVLCSAQPLASSACAVVFHCHQLSNHALCELGWCPLFTLDQPIS